jgi:hypothetical protein
VTATATKSHHIATVSAMDTNLGQQGVPAGAGVWITTPNGWIRGNQIVEVQHVTSSHSSYGREVVSHCLKVTQLAVRGAEGGPSTFSLWQTEGVDGKALARAAVTLMELLSGPGCGVVVFKEGRIKLASFTEAKIAL